MYYLSYYPKLYHKEHIPFHYVLMTGYDDDQRLICLYDCGRTQLLTLGYDELKNSMNCSYPGLSSENTICTVRMTEKRSKNQIASEREQWNDGSNTLCIAPGVIVVYERNDVTNEVLRKAGLKVLEMPSAELSRGRGGPRCMSMPLIRED